MVTFMVKWWWTRELCPRSVAGGDDFNFGIQYDSSREKSSLYVSQKMEPWTRSLMHRIEHASESAAWPQLVTDKAHSWGIVDGCWWAPKPYPFHLAEGCGQSLLHFKVFQWKPFVISLFGITPGRLALDGDTCSPDTLGKVANRID